MLRIGILGGTFDPPHIGHLVLADCAIDSLGLDQLLFVPAGDPPHKHNETRLPISHRMAMLDLALGRSGRFTLSRIDVDRPGPHYAVDMVRIVKAQYPEAELYFVMGGDSFYDLPQWYCPEDLVKLCKLAVMPRTAFKIAPDMHEAALPGTAAVTVMIDAPLVELSSTEIVDRLRQGKTVRYLVPEPVLSYIASHQVYQG